jgi:hypothetical protein
MGWDDGRPGRLRTLTDRLTTVRRRASWPRTVPAAVLNGTELIHLGGGESLPCPDADRLPLTPTSSRLGLGTSALALPPARVHVLHDAVVYPGSRVVGVPDGRIVAESVTTDMVGRAVLDHREMKAPPIRIDGTVAIFRSPLRSRYHTLIDHLPRAGLLIHPAMRRVGPITVLHDGPLSPLETWLLGHLSGRNIRLLQVEPGTPLRAERVLVPSYVTRPRAGAVPSWYRRWADAVPLEEPVSGPRRVFLDRRSGVGHIANQPEVDAVLAAHGVERLDPGDWKVAELLGLFRAADLVVGMPGSGMAQCLFSRRTHMIELLRGTTVSPELYYLAACKGLPYDFVPATTDPPANHPERYALDVDVAWLDRLLGEISA